MRWILGWWRAASKLTYDSGLRYFQAQINVVISPESIVLRAAHASEAAAIAAMSRLHIEHGLTWRWRPSRIKKNIRDPETMVLAATVRGDLAGFAIMKFGDEDAHLYLLAVHPRFRRHGIGKSMVEWLEKSCRTAGIQRIRLEVRTSNQVARKFYERLGYSFVAQVAGYYDGREAAVIMARSLTQYLTL